MYITLVSVSAQKIDQQKEQDIRSWVESYDEFITINQTQKDKIIELYKERYLEKIKVSYDTTLDDFTKPMHKKKIDKKYYIYLSNIISPFQAKKIQRYHSSKDRIGQIKFMVELTPKQKEELHDAIFTLKLKNLEIEQKYGNQTSPEIAEEKKNARMECSNREKEILTKQQYDILKNVKLVTVVNWGENENTDLLNTDNYNVLDPLEYN
ncbi:hypothetical protein [Flammeovirga kamogawensis]|nr:hypothetical protein [Flammeovirga kamogawensis]MBB6462628.1 hypothetical protein [Flammeovirga kamogawensis]